MDIKYLILLSFVLFTATQVWGEYIPPGPRYRCPKNHVYINPCTCNGESDEGITVTCKNTNLAKISLVFNNLAELAIPVETLTLYKCNIARLFGSALYKLQVKVLRIIDTPIQAIDQYTFLGVNNTLNELHILNSSLQEFPKLAIRILGNLSVLKIDQHKISNLSKDAFIDSDIAGKLLRLYISNGNISELPIESLQSLRRLKTLDLHGNKLNNLKRNQFKGLREVEILDLSFNKLTKLEGSQIADLIKMGWCNVSHNSIAEITRGVFARNSVLKVLNMSHNKIRKLDSNSFRGMRFLRRLYLSDNLINDVGRGTFSGITRIGTIDIARNSIKKIDYQMFYQLNYVEIIDASQNNITEIHKLAFKDIYLAKINLSRNAIEKIEKGAFQNCANITILDLSHNQISNFTKQTFDETTYATELQLSYNLLTDMGHIPLHNMTGLKVLNVSYNKIVRIPKNAFPKLYELHTIDLSHNNLSDIFNAVFQTLFSLRMLNLSYNSLETIKPSTFGTIPTLLEMDLSYNTLRDIARSGLTRLASMRTLTVKGNKLKNLFQLPISVSHLDVSENQIDEIPAKFWPSMNSLLSLDFSFNQLSDNLVQGSFQNLLTLQKLNLNGNGLSQPPWAALGDLTALQYLHLEHNQISDLYRAAFGRLPVVFELNLAHNKLFNISVKAFEGLLQLLVLNMSHNYIKNIPNGAFEGLVSLRTLDLSYNYIDKLENNTNGLLDDCLSLESVNLSFNKISSIRRKTFPSSPYIPYKLKEIDLSYNAMPLITYDLVLGTAKLEKLNLSHNSIAGIRRYVLGNLTQLKSLDLSYNHLEDLHSDKDIFHLPANLSALFLSNNVLQDLPWKEFSKVTHMDTLELTFNKFTSFDKILTEMADNGTDVYFEGNNLNCDCLVRPLKRYFSNQLEVKPFYKTVKCRNPPYLFEEKLFEITEDRLYCAQDVNSSLMFYGKFTEYDVTADLQITQLKLTRLVAKLKWSIVKNEDIADFLVVLRKVNNPQNIYFSETVPYYKRKLEIDLKNVNLTNTKFNLKEYEICIVAKNSKGNVRKLYKNQCKDTFDSIVNGNSAILSYSLLIILLFVTGYSIK